MIHSNIINPIYVEFFQVVVTLGAAPPTAADVEDGSYEKQITVLWTCQKDGYKQNT
jgi:hypothetical protein